MTTPGERNNNPLNIKWVQANHWKGLADPQCDEQGFCRFIDPTYGFRTAAIILMTYQDRDEVRTVETILSKWAPTSDNNDVETYIADVCERGGFIRNERLDLHTYEDQRPLLGAMGWHENGEFPWTNAQVDKGLVMAGIQPPEESLSKTKTVKGAQVAGGAGLITVATGLAEKIDPDSPWVSKIFDVLWKHPGTSLLILGGIILLGVGVIVYDRWDDRRKALR